MNPSFVLVLKDERWIDVSKTDNYIWLQIANSKAKVKESEVRLTTLAKEEFPFTNLQFSPSQIYKFTKECYLKKTPSHFMLSAKAPHGREMSQ